MSPDCTESCKSIQHGEKINAAITKRGVSDDVLCSFLNYTCNFCENVKDSTGRTALHVAASCGRIDLLRWLITKRKANINGKDDESGYTALHRSLFYGKIDSAVELIKLGASISLQDVDCLTPLEHVIRDGRRPTSHYGELYTWGTNTSNSLGPYEKRETPEYFDSFHKNMPKLACHVVLNKFHSIVLTMSGEAYACGHGLGGRLGLGSEQASIVPKKISFPPNHLTVPVGCLQACVGRDHTLFLMSDNSIYSCGLNAHKVLGISPPPEKLLAPSQLKFSRKDIIGIAAGRYHSIAWSYNALYYWGLNAGQMGIRLGRGIKHVITPRQIHFTNSYYLIRSAASSDGAIAVVTSNGDIYVLHEFQCRKIGSRQLAVREVSIVGGRLDPTIDKDARSESNRELKVIALTKTGNILLWQESDPQLCRCLFTIPRTIIVKQVAINANEILFVTDYGEAYRATIKQRKRRNGERSVAPKNALHKFLERDDCINLKLTKFPKVYRAVSIASDPRGEDYCVIQQEPYQLFTFKKSKRSDMSQELNDLLDEADEKDNLHDVIFKAENRLFPAHRYIIARQRTPLNTLMEKDGQTIQLDVNADIFKEFLVYIYTGKCRLIEECPDHLKKYCQTDFIDGSKLAYEIYNKNKLNPIRTLQALAKSFDCQELYKLLLDYDMEECKVVRRSHKYTNIATSFQMLEFPEYHDVTIECSDGRLFKAHKCMLSARMEYFKNMFSIRWNDAHSNKIKFPYPGSTVEVLLEYVYTDRINVGKKTDLDFLVKLLILSDQYFVTSLKESVEQLLATRLNLKNSIEILIFAHHYNAPQLKSCVLLFIVHNAAFFLETQVLEPLDDEILREINECYFKHKKEVRCRVITPYSTAISDEEIEKIHQDYPVQLDIERKEKITPKNNKRRSRTHKASVSDKKEVQTTPEKSEPIPDEVVLTNVTNNVLKRLDAITLAKETLIAEELTEDYTKLTDFPVLNNSKGLNKTPKGKFKMAKISQKEKKRLCSESSESNNQIESPKNPWKVIVPVDSSQSNVDDLNISNIISDERKQKENLEKIKSKSLFFTQIEDRAIAELEKFYNCDNVEDELISVGRVNINLAAPIWVLKS